MKCVILAGGFGTRLSEETQFRPKPMVEIGGRPILWHIMKGYAHYGITDFIICLGHKSEVIKEYFVNYFVHSSDIRVDLNANTVSVLKNQAEPWTVTLVDTGVNTMTGGRAKRIREYLDEDEDFCLTYGDGVSNVDIDKLIAFHQEQNVLATVTAVEPPGRFGLLDMTDYQVRRFVEKPQAGSGWINGGFFVLSPKVLDYIDGDSTILEKTPLERLAQENQLCAYRHPGFWYAMDSLRDRQYLEELWMSGNAQWKVWT